MRPFASEIRHSRAKDGTQTGGPARGQQKGGLGNDKPPIPSHCLDGAPLHSVKIADLVCVLILRLGAVIEGPRPHLLRGFRQRFAAEIAEQPRRGPQPRPVRPAWQRHLHLKHSFRETELVPPLRPRARSVHFAFQGVQGLSGDSLNGENFGKGKFATSRNPHLLEGSGRFLLFLMGAKAIQPHNHHMLETNTFLSFPPPGTPLLQGGGGLRGGKFSPWDISKRVLLVCISAISGLWPLVSPPPARHTCTTQVSRYHGGGASASGAAPAQPPPPPPHPRDRTVPMGRGTASGVDHSLEKMLWL